MREVLAEHRPTVVFHAAAYKHVGLMEANPVEAVRNNALATRVVARIAGEPRRRDASCSSRPTRRSRPATVMGASKALAEWAVEAAAQRFPDTRFATVRFGNVLGSSGSVVPIFRRQIAARRPGHRHRRAHDALLHDDPRGGAAHHPLGLARPRAARSSCSTWASRWRSCELARDDDRAVGPASPTRDIAIEVVGAPAGREAPRGAVQPLRAPAAHAGREDPARRARAARPRLASSATFDEIGLLVLEGDAAGLAAKVGELSARARADSAVRAPA